MFKIKGVAHFSNTVRTVHMKALRIYPNAVIHARLAAGFCANRWAEEFSNHSRCSMGHRPNEFILKFSPRSIVIRFFVSLCLSLFTGRMFDGTPPKTRVFQQKVDTRVSSRCSFFSNAFQILPPLAWNCFDSSSHLLSFIHGSRELIGDLQICHDRRYVITAPVKDKCASPSPLGTR